MTKPQPAQKGSPASPEGPAPIDPHPTAEPREEPERDPDVTPPEAPIHGPIQKVSAQAGTRC
jgi:hypothetical protein